MTTFEGERENDDGRKEEKLNELEAHESLEE